MPIPKLEDTPLNNQILAALPEAEFNRIKASLEYLELEDDKVLWGAEDACGYLYFPTTAVISLLYYNETGASISIGLLGRNGVAGTSVVTGNVRSPESGAVQFAGGAYRLKASSVSNELAECGDFHSLVMTYTSSLMAKISQNAICNRLHRIEQQVCRLLLDLRNELQSDSLTVTHDAIAGVLGVRRESVSLAAANLQKTGMIKANRGRIRIVNAEKLEASSCECYAVVKDHLERSLKKYSLEHPR